MKRAAILLLSLLMAVTVAACAGSQTTAQEGYDEVTPFLAFHPSDF